MSQLQLWLSPGFSVALIRFNYIYIGLPQIKLCYHYKSHIITILAGVEPSMATRLTVNGQDFSQVNGVTSGCCWIKFPHAAVGVPLESVETSLTWDAI